MIQKKTGRPVLFEITQDTRASVGNWLSEADHRNGFYLFPSRFRRKLHARPGIRRALSMVGSRAPGSTTRLTTHTRCAGRKRHRSTRRPVTGGSFNLSWAIPSLRARSDISTSRSMTRSASGSRLRALRPTVAVLRTGGPRLPGPTMAGCAHRCPGQTTSHQRVEVAASVRTYWPATSRVERRRIIMMSAASNSIPIQRQSAAL